MEVFQNTYSFINDIVFKAVFGRETDTSKTILIDFLNSVISEESADVITSVEIKNPFIVDHIIEGKKPILDIRAVLDTGEQINIEVQVQKTKYFTQRMVYYLAKLHGSQLIKGDDFGKLRRTIQIQIVNFNAVNINKAHTCYRLKEQHYHYELTNHIELHCLQLPYVDDKISIESMDDFTKWMTVIKDINNQAFQEIIEVISEQKEVIKMAVNEYKKLSEDELLRARIEDMEKAEIDRASDLYYAREEGREEGKKEISYQIAKNLKEEGFPLMKIAQMTGLSEMEIEQL